MLLVMAMPKLYQWKASTFISEDMHAITAANNALSALIDNHLHQGNKLGIDQRQIITNDKWT